MKNTVKQQAKEWAIKNPGSAAVQRAFVDGYCAGAELTRLQSQQAEGMREAFAELIEKYKRVTFSHYLNMPEHRALSRQYKQEYDLKAMRFCEEEVAKYVALLEPSAHTPDKNREI